MLQPPLILRAEHEGLTTRFQGEIILRKQYQKEYEEMEGCFKTEKENKPIDSATISTLETRIKELESKLSRNNAGRPKNKHTDQDIMDLRNQGKTIRDIVSCTGMSSATVVKILKGFKSE